MKQKRMIVQPMIDYMSRFFLAFCSSNDTFLGLYGQYVQNKPTTVGLKKCVFNFETDQGRIPLIKRELLTKGIDIF